MDDKPLQEFEIWAEGYACTGESGTATFKGRANGETFKAACASFFRGDPNYNERQNSWWCCKLYSTRAQAQRSFG